MRLKSKEITFDSLKRIRNGWMQWSTMRKEASYTIEAALIMAITLFLIAALLTEAFGTHSQVIGDMVLQDALEQASHMEEGQEIKEITERSARDMRDYFWCGDKRMDITDGVRRLKGIVTGEKDSNISVKKFDPEKFLRLLRAVGI